MSRTDKTRPHWVKKFDPDADVHVDHDHRSGDCIVETLESERAYYTGFKPWKHTRRCKKRVRVDYNCTKAAPEYRNHGHGVRCWSTIFGRDEETGWFSHNRLGCSGHTRVEFHDEIACSCDIWKTDKVPTCRVWPTGRYTATLTEYYGKTVPKWFIDHRWNNPERVRERDTLNRARTEYNTGYDLDEFDFPNYQHRHGAGWDFY